MKIVTVLLLLHFTVVNADLTDSWTELKTSFVNLIYRWIDCFSKLGDRVTSSKEWTRFTTRLTALWEELIGSFRDLRPVLAVAFSCIGNLSYEFITSDEVSRCVASFIDLVSEILASLFENLTRSKGDSNSEETTSPKCPPSVGDVCRKMCATLKGDYVKEDRQKICRRFSAMWHPDRYADGLEKEFANVIFLEVRKSCDDGWFRTRLGSRYC